MIRVDLTNADQVIARLRQQIARLQDMSVPLAQSGVYVRNAAVTRIKDQGGDQAWVPSKSGGHTGIDTGRMMSSIAISQSNPTSVTIGTNVPYARWFQEGTGIYAGHSAWTVRPKAKKALAFTIDGVRYVRRSVTIPGQPARPFLVLTDENRAKIRAIFQRWFAGVSGTSVQGVNLG